MFNVGYYFFSIMLLIDADTSKREYPLTLTSWCNQHHWPN